MSNEVLDNSCGAIFDVSKKSALLVWINRVHWVVNNRWECIAWCGLQISVLCTRLAANEVEAVFYDCTILENHIKGSCYLFAVMLSFNLLALCFGLCVYKNLEISKVIKAGIVSNHYKCLMKNKVKNRLHFRSVIFL